MSFTDFATGWPAGLLAIYALVMLVLLTVATHVRWGPGGSVFSPMIVISMTITAIVVFATFLFSKAGRSNGTEEEFFIGGAVAGMLLSAVWMIFELRQWRRRKMKDNQ